MQRGFAQVYILLGLIILALVAGGAYYFGRQSITSSQNQNPQTTYVKPASSSNTYLPPFPSSSPDETANWKKYTSSECGFQLKYPQDWSSKTINTGDLKKFCAYLTGPDYKEIPNSDGIFGMYVVLTRTIKGSIFKGITINSLDDYIKADNNIIEPVSQIVSEIRHATYGNISGKYYVLSTMNITSNFIFEKDNYIYNFNWIKDYDQKYRKDLEAIMASVQF